VQGQIEWTLNYIKERYGTPVAAWAHEMSAGWYESGGILGHAPLARLYDTGGILSPGATVAMNATGANEYVFTPQQVQALGSMGAPPSGTAAPVQILDHRQIIVQSDVSQSTMSQLNRLLDAHDKELIDDLTAAGVR
jgi:hypothetical protein